MPPADDIKRWSDELAERAIGATVSKALSRVSGVVVLFPPPLEDGAQALLVDDQGLVLAGRQVDDAGNDVGQDVAAQLTGVAEEAGRTVRMLELGAWRSMLVETAGAGIALGPAADGALVVVTAPRSTPLGMVRRFLARTVRAAAAWSEQRR